MPESLPNQMRQLIHHLDQSLLVPTRRALAATNEERQHKLNQLQASIEETQMLFEAARNQHKIKAEQEKADAQSKSGVMIREAESLIARCGSLLSSAEKHLKDNWYSAPAPDYSLGSLAGGDKMDLKQAQSEVARASDIMTQMRKTEINGQVFHPSGFGSLMLIAAFAGAVCLASLTANSGGNFLTFFLWWPAVYFGLGLIRVFFRKSLLSGQYSNLAGIVVRVQNDLNHQLEQARAELLAQTQTIENQHHAELRELSDRQRQKEAEQESARAAIHQQYHANLQACEAKFAVDAEQARQACTLFRESAGYTGVHWDESIWQQWTPATSPAFVASFGALGPTTEDLHSIFPTLDLGFLAPALIPFADGKCLLLKASGSALAQAAQCLQAVMVRLLATIPPGKVNFTLIDPVGLGKNVAVMMKLAEYEEALIKSRAWTEPPHIEQRLAELTEHMETVIQKYLRTDYNSIEDYNRDAKKIAEPYRVLVVMDFPVNFTDTAARRLVSIAQNGPRCGVYTLIVMNTEKPHPHGFNLAELEQHSFVISHDGQAFVWGDPEFKDCHLTLDQPPANNLSNTIIEQVGQQAKEAMKVEVPFAELLAEAGLSDGQWWRGATARKLEVPLGPTGARKRQMLTFGEGLSHHGLIVGRPGSGKTNLMHVIITTLGLAYAPSELQVYLIDFKKGVGFKPYADYKLPHAIAIAIESEREFGLSVLQGLDAEMQRRGEKFRAASVEDISEYRRKVPQAEMPRLLLVADEFQEFFTHNDNINTQATMLLDRLTRQGRAFGIHILLGTQTLQGANAMPKSIMNQIAVRIALQCSEEDSRIVLSHDNPAARLLSRPGEAIYNAANGLVEGNNLFQVALFNDDDRTRYLRAIADKAKGGSYEPIIFEGNEPARPETVRPLNELLAQPAPTAKPKAADAWLGEPTAIRPPVRARLRRQGGSNLLIVSREEAEGVGMIFSALLSLAAQHAPAQAQFYIVNLATADSDWFEWVPQLTELLPHPVKVVGGKQTPGLLKELADEVTRRTNEPAGNAPALFLTIIGLQRARDLREEERGLGHYGAKDDPPSANKLFATLLREGPEAGLHTLVWCDTVASFNRVARPQLREFGLRVATAMSSADSSALLDDGVASKLDKPHRAIFYDDERPGVFEKFRPYGLPSPEWLQQAAARLRNRA